MSVYYSKVLLKFMSTKLFELIGLSWWNQNTPTK
jgi:hypothetical protein